MVILNLVKSESGDGLGLALLAQEARIDGRLRWHRSILAAYLGICG